MKITKRHKAVTQYRIASALNHLLIKSRRKVNDKKIILLMLIFFKSITLFGQSIPLAIPPSPNAAALGSYGQIPVSFFNGLPQIEIPIGKVETGTEDVDISLSYHAGGIRPDIHSSWAGLGWNVNAGGMITRIVNGVADEKWDPGVSPVDALSYYDHPDGLAASDWASVAALTAYSAATGPKVILSPDEFMFNFGGYSGSFFYDHQGKWQFKSTQGLHLSVKEELLNDFVLEQKKPGLPSLTLKRIFYKFTLTVPDGTQYVFGGTPQSIEFSRGSSGNDSYNNGVVPNSWYLTKIISRNGQETNFAYERGDILGTMSSNLSIYASNRDFQDNYTNLAEVLFISNPVYLKSIETDLQKVTFARSVSNELPYDFSRNSVFFEFYNSIGNYTDLKTYSSTDSGSANIKSLIGMIKYQKLDSISFYEKPSGFMKKIAFSYIENPNSRLVLKSMQKSGSGETEPAYQFAYNNTPLPPYNSRMLDHWGFYNGVDFLSNYPLGYNWDFQQIGLTRTPYEESKASNFSYMEAGNLVYIKYPQGGKTIFEYEPNEYASIADRFMYNLVTTDNTQAGGLRIKKISQLDEFDQLSGSKEYKYVANYNLGGGISSGILAGKPLYLEAGSIGASSYNHWYDRMVQPLHNTNGNHITYTEVAEKNPDGSYIIYNYSNHNQVKYRDKAPLNQVNNNSSTIDMDPFISMELDRGKMLRRREYRADNIIQRETTYEYDENSNRTNLAIRFRSMQERTIGYFNPISDKRVTAYLVYYFPRLLTKETQKIYDTNGLNPDSLQKKFTYDPVDLNLRSERYANSKGDSVITKYTYPGNMLSQDPNGTYQEMYTKHIISPRVETTSLINSTQTLYQRTNFYKPYAGIFAPKTIEEKIGDGRLTTKRTYSDYDSKGNVLSFFDRKGVKTSYIWSYYSRYPVAEIVNADYQAIVNIATSSGIDNFRNSIPNKTSIDNFLAPLKTTLPNAYISSSSYKGVTGISSETDMKGKTGYYDYDGLQRKKNSRDQNNFITKNLSYNFRPQTGFSTYYSVEKSGVFTKQTCGPDKVGSPITYTVPAGKHSSQISQDEANRLAQKDLEVNGPLYANKYGQCIDICNTEGKKMVAGICETGTKIYSGSVSQGNGYLCTYYYRWSDGSISGNYTEISSNPCYDEGGL